jgi:hypothetical protein
VSKPLRRHSIQLRNPLLFPDDHDKLVANDTISAPMPLAIVDVFERHDLVVHD